MKYKSNKTLILEAHILELELAETRCLIRRLRSDNNHLKEIITLQLNPEAPNEID